MVPRNGPGLEKGTVDMRSFVRVFIIALGLFLPLLVAFAQSPAAGVEPDVKIFLAVDAAIADPQDLLTYTIWIDNAGPQPAPSLWVNDTLPTGTTYVGDTAAADIGPPAYVGNSTAGSTHRFQFANFPAGNLSFRISARVALAVTDGEILRDTTLLWYTNATGVAQPTRAAGATTTVSIPVISATKTGAFTGPNAVTYAVTIFNSGSSAALFAWWNDSIPTGIQYVTGSVRGNPPPLGAVCASSGQWLNCTLRNPLPPGSKSWLFDATIPTPLPPGTVVTNHVFVNYTDSDGTYLGEARASVPLTIATANIQVFKLADAARVPPGGTIGYTIFYNNTGQAGGRGVWINDTLPTSAALPAVTVVSTNPAPIIQTQSVVKWQLADVATGVHYVTLAVRALASLGDGTVLTNSVILNYTDANGNVRPGSAGSATSTVSVNVPSFAAELVANRATVEPGGAIGYTLYYNNSRPALAASVVIEVLVPSGIALASANPVWSTSAPGKFIWNLTNVGGGGHRITIVADIPTTAVVGSTVRTIAFANYTDDLGTPVGGAPAPPNGTGYIPT